MPCAVPILILNLYHTQLLEELETSKVYKVYNVQQKVYKSKERLPVCEQPI